MERIFKNVTELIGNTPILELANYRREKNLPGKIFAKLEFLNPAGSVKDRIAFAMLDEAEKSGKLKPGTVIVEPTSGNTGIGLASVAAAKGYKVILTMPDTMSVERRSLLKAYGAQLVLTEGALGMKGAIAKAYELAEAMENSYVPGQFVNPANPMIHKTTTGPEIWKDMDGKIDFFVAGIGTGGTISGAGSFLKNVDNNIKIIAVEPEDSPVLSGGTPGPHKIQGIGAGFIPEILDTKIYDEVIKVKNEEAFTMGRYLPGIEGILIGISSGAALHAATIIAQREENKDKRIVVIFPSNGERYISTAMFAQ